MTTVSLIDDGGSRFFLKRRYISARLFAVAGHKTVICDYKLDNHGSVLHDKITKMTNKMHLCGIICCFLATLHVSSNIFAHNQEHQNCVYSFRYYSRMSLPAGVTDELELRSNSSVTRACSDIRE